MRSCWAPRPRPARPFRFNRPRSSSSSTRTSEERSARCASMTRRGDEVDNLDVSHPRRQRALDGRRAEVRAAGWHLHRHLPCDLGRHAHRLRRPRVQHRPRRRRAEVHGRRPDRSQQERQGHRDRLRFRARPRLPDDRAAARRPRVRARRLAAGIRRGGGRRAAMAGGLADLCQAHAITAGSRGRVGPPRERARHPAAGRERGRRVAVGVAEKHDPAKHPGKPLRRGVGTAGDRLAGAGRSADARQDAPTPRAARTDRALRGLPGDDSGAQRPREHPEPDGGVLSL